MSALLPLKILILEDRPADAELMLDELRQFGFDPDWQRVQTKAEYLAGLNATLDVILADYKLPHFDGITALALMREQGLDIPFILVSGSIGEELAVSAMKQGAADYLLKDRLARLGAAVANALESRRLRDQQRQAEALLRESEVRYRTLVEQASDGIFIANSERRYIHVNSAGCRLLGYTRDEILEKTISDLIRADPNLPLRMEELRQGKTLITNREMICKDGSLVPVEISAKQLSDGSFQGIVRDTTESKRMEDARKASETRYRRLFEAAKDGILILDASTGLVVDVNPFLLDLLGYSQEEILGKELWEIGLFRDIVASKSAFQELQDRGYIRYEDLPLETRTGRHIQVEFVSNVYLVNDEKVIQCNIRDITERKRAEENLRKLNRILAVLSDVNQAIVRIRLPSELFETVCRIAVEHGGFRMAWVGLLDPETRRVNPVAHAGITGDYLEKLDIVLNDEKLGNGPTGSVARTGRHVFVNDIDHDPRMAPWRDNALKLGYRASAAFPLKVASEVRGVFSLYSDVPEFFDAAELKLLDEMAEDISFAMEFAEQETQRKQAKTALEQHTKAVEAMRLFLQTTLDAFPANTVVLDPDGTIINVNAGWIQFADENNGAAPMHYLGVNYLTVSDTSDGDWSEEAASTAAGIRAVIDASQDEFYLEYPCHSPTERRWFALRVTPFPEPAPRRVVAAHINITERRLAEEAEHEQRRFAEALRDSLAALTSSLDVDTVMQQILNNAAQVVPYESASIIQFEADTARASYLSGFSPAAEAFFRAFQYNKPYPEHLARIEQNQPYFIADTRSIADWINIPLTPEVRSSIGVPIIMTNGLLGMLSVDSSTPNRYTPDAVERLKIFARYAAIALENAYHALHLEQKVVERTAELQMAKERIELLLSHSADAILLLQPDFTIQQTNAAFNDLFDCEQDDYFGQPVTALVELSAGDVLTTMLQNSLDHNRQVNVDVEARRKNSTLFAVELSIVSIRNDGFVCTIHDISQRKQVEQSLHRAVEKEKELNQLKTRFVSMASHEFRTPLATIHATTETLSAYRQKLTDDQIEQKLSNIREQVGHLKDIMDDVLNLAQLQARRFEFNPIRANPDALCREIIAEFQSHKDITHDLLYTCESDVSPVQLDIKLMRQLITNLVSNAIKYAPENKTIQIKLRHTGDTLILTVQDGGIGIPEADLKHLFEAFHRGANVGNIHGTGLGLVIAKESVDLHGGTITVESQMGTGTTFTVKIPVKV